jgi:tRNA C32,U32 (ribose-2'-O)-methylase TrmJ
MQVREYVVTERGARVLGVEIAPEAWSVATLPFTGSTAFILGNEGQGLSPAQVAICDGFVYIAQHGRGTASLNVACAAAIVLHRFSEWAGYAEAPRDAEQPGKFAVAERPQRTAPRGAAGHDAEEVRAERAAAREAAARQADAALDEAA